MLETLSFRYPFRKYQRMMLDQVEAGTATSPYHLVAPPGSGKTIVGLELVRRTGRPAVVFAPTTTIQQQWQAEVGMFTDDERDVERLTSVDPHDLATINCFTYQLISTAGGSRERLEAIARRAWIDDLVAEGMVADEPAAIARLETLRANNPRAHRAALRRRAVRARRRLLREPDVDVAQFLHANACDLIDRLVEHGVGTVVLDECHHLLDYWAIVLRHLIDRIAARHGEATVIGLTATLPSPDGDREYENYTSLLGEVDFEVPTPAVVKEGDLAPYRDLVHFVQPTARERAFLEDLQSAFEDALVDLLDETGFGDWVVARLTGDDDAAHFATLLRGDAAFAVAAARFCAWEQRALPAHVDLPAEAGDDLTVRDWGVLLERFGLDVLKTSAEPADHERLDRLRRTLQGFGLTLTERGLRQSRSAGDLVLAFSEAKDRAVADVLAREHGDLGERLRAVVVTDFARASSAVRSAAAPLHADAGSAQRVFRHLVGDPRTHRLDPVLVTGRAVRAGADWADALVAFFDADLARRGYRASARVVETATDGVVEIAGEGPDWGSHSYVAMITDALADGLVRCLVGTRGLFGEGWDSLVVNTLVDLTSVTTSTSVQQLRGRSIRLDPRWPRKVAHNWDIVCVARQFEGGDADVRRFQRRHEKYWGLTPVSRGRQAWLDAQRVLDQGDDAPLGGEIAGRITRGVLHVDEQLAVDLAFRPFARVRFTAATRRCLREVGRRERTYDAWAVGEDYSNFAYAATRLDAGDLRFRTVHTVRDTVRALLRRFRAAVAAGLAFTVLLVAQNVAAAAAEGAPLATVLLVAAVVAGLGFVITAGLSARSAWRLASTVLLEQPPDAILRDAARAVLGGLRDAGLVSRHLDDRYVRIVVQDDGSYEVLVDYAAPDDAATFTRAYRQVLGPVRDPRYLVLRDDSRLGEVGVGAVWLALRPLVRAVAGGEPAYHPVPDVLGANRERAESFAAHWRRHVGGGRLVYTRSEDGWRVLARARAHAAPTARALAFEVWA